MLDIDKHSSSIGPFMRYELSSNITLEWKKQALTTLAYTANTAVKSFMIQASRIHDASFSL